ncbi:MAG: peptidase M48, partial [Xanthomonadales bacterium]|nr:peptidase M48 [Xanthomonadales bacterium]
DADSEEVSHMLFGDGRKMMMFSTHPPLNERIRRVDPDFQSGDLDRLAAKILQERKREQEADQSREKAAEPPSRGVFDAGNIIDQIGNPDWERMLMAAALAASIPDNIRQAAHSTEWAPEVLFYSLLDRDEELRERQLLVVARRMGSDSESQVRALLKSGGVARPEQRLPLLEVAFPALKRRPPDFVARVLETANALIEVDGKVDVFEYLLARVITLQLQESRQPHRVKVAGRKGLAAFQTEALQVMAVLTDHGHDDEQSRLAAFRAGLGSLGLDPSTAPPASDEWVRLLDRALPRLDELKSADKEKLVRALAAVVLHDGRMVASELELLRAVCDLIHVPLPLLTGS